MWTQYLRLKNIENITIEVTKWSIIVKPHETTYTLEVTTSVGKFYYQKTISSSLLIFMPFFNKSAKEIIQINIFKLNFKFLMLFI